MDKIVFDIETKNTFADVGGHSRLADLDVSLIGAYSFDQKKYFSYTEHELESASELFKNAGLLIGFSINRFDIPVLAKYFSFNISSIPTLDILEELEAGMGKRVSLDILAKANLGIGKTHQSLEAIRLYKENKIDELRNYCLNDVRLTKDLYELAEKQRFLKVPQRDSAEILSVPLDWREKLLDVSMMQRLL